MRPVSLVCFAISASWLAGVDAQESTGGIPEELLCDQCPWDAPVRIRRDDFSSPGTTTVITAEDMRSLGVVTSADMINQLPNGIGAYSTEVSGSESEAPSDPGGSIEGLRRLRIESIEQDESDDASAEVPADDAASAEEGQAEE